MFLHLCSFQFSLLRAFVVCVLAFSFLYIHWDTVLLILPQFNLVRHSPPYSLLCFCSDLVRQVNYCQILINFPIPHHPTSAPSITVLTTSEPPLGSLVGFAHLPAPSPLESGSLPSGSDPFFQHYFPPLQLRWTEHVPHTFPSYVFWKGISHWNPVCHRCCCFQKAFLDPFLKEFVWTEKLSFCSIEVLFLFSIP